MKKMRDVIVVSTVALEIVVELLVVPIKTVTIAETTISKKRNIVLAKVFAL